MSQKTQKANGAANLDAVNVSEKIILSSLDKFVQKRVLQLPYQKKTVKNLTNVQKIELMQSLLLRIGNGDATAMAEAQKLQDVDNFVQVPVKGITGLTLLLEVFKYIQEHKIDEILQKVSDNFEVGSEEKRIIGYYLETGMIVSANPSMIEEEQEEEEEQGVQRDEVRMEEAMEAQKEA